MSKNPGAAREGSTLNRREFHRVGAAALGAIVSGNSFGAQFSYPWKLGVITDEVSLDLNKALTSFFPKYQLRWAEIRNMSLDGKNSYVYKSATPEQLKRIKKRLDDADVKVSGLDTAVYKIALPGTKPLGKNDAD